ncbi:MAG: SgcJ/EcaC family oxidoreductase [Thermoproteota archaeon]|nr:SgcJ/EcaC family oxidoreductase [Thermoproteota archaeon]
MENTFMNNKRENETTISNVNIEEEKAKEGENNINTIGRVLEALNTGDVSKVHEFISPEYFNHESQVDPVRSKLRGPEEFIDTVKNLRSAFSDLHYEEQETIASGDKVISILNVTGKHVGNFFGIAPPTGRDISYQAIHIHRIGNDRKIVEHRAIRDDLTFMMQLGIVGPSSTQYEPLFQDWKDFMHSQTSHRLSTTSKSSPDEAAIRALYQQMIDGWNTGSGNAFAAPYTEDGDLVGFDGTHLKGCLEIASFHQQLFDTFLKGSRLVGKIRSVRFLTADVALIHAVSGTIMAGQSDIDPERNSIQTLVAIKCDGEWRLAAFQNTRAQFLGRPDAFQALTEELRQEL